MREVTPPKGYKLDEKIYTFTINGGDTSLSVEDEPGTLTLRLKKEDSQTGSTPQGNASLTGAVYQVSYQKGGQTVTEEMTSDASGNLGTLEGLPLGTVTVKELSAPEGYRLDTEVHTYTVDGSQLTGDTYTLEVDDLTEEVQRGGLTIQKLDSETGTTPQGDASLEGIQFEIVNQSQNPVVVNGTTATPGQVAMTITTDASGVATTGEDALPTASTPCVSLPPMIPCSKLSRRKSPLPFQKMDRFLPTKQKTKSSVAASIWTSRTARWEPRPRATPALRESTLKSSIAAATPWWWTDKPTLWRMW